MSLEQIPQPDKLPSPRIVPLADSHHRRQRSRRFVFYHLAIARDKFQLLHCPFVTRGGQSLSQLLRPPLRTKIRNSQDPAKTKKDGGRGGGGGAGERKVFIQTVDEIIVVCFYATSVIIIIR